MGQGRLGTVACLAATVTACNAILGIEERPLRPSAEADGGPDASGAHGGPDAAADGGVVDGASGVCAARHLFCDDFGGAPFDPATRWDDALIGAGPIELDPSDFASAPRSLRVSLIAGGGSRTTMIEKRIGTPGVRSSVSVSFAVRIEAPGSEDFGAISYASVSLLPTGGTSAHTISLYEYAGASPGISYFRPGATDSDKAELTPPLPVGRWQRIALRILLGTSPKVSVAVDGTPAAVLAIDPIEPTELRLTLGLDTAEANTTTVVRFDDVTVDAE